MASVVEQLRRNSVALVSMVIAVTSLAYNTWRNEVTEGNRNIRAAGLEIIGQLAGLQEVVLFARFSPQDLRGDFRTGWAHVLAVKDYAIVMPAGVMVAADELSITWDGNFEALADRNDEKSYAEIDTRINAAKAATQAALANLD